MKYNKIILTLLSIILIFGAWKVGVKVGQLPHDIYVAPADHENIIQWKKNWREAGNSIVTASVIGDSSEKLYLYLDYIYSGTHGDTVTACGGIRGKDEVGKWSCSPVGVKRGRGFVTLKMSLSSGVSGKACSNEVGVRIYDKRGSTFLEEWYPYQKIWIKGADGINGKIQEFFTLC